MSNAVKFYLEDLEVGMSATTSMTITAEKIDTFAETIGDFNPIHVDEEAAKAAGAVTSKSTSSMLPRPVLVPVSGRTVASGQVR